MVQSKLTDIRGLNVLSVAYPVFPVGPDSSGGAEQILFLLDREIVRRGGRSLVIAAEGSAIAGQLIPTPAAEGLLSDAAQEDARRQHRRAIENTVRENSVDLIHFHGLDFDSYVPETDWPMLATLHLPLAWYSPAALTRKDVQLVCVSRSQSAGSGLRVILNGIDVQRFGTAEKQDYLLWIGRICPEKGVHIALEVAHDVDIPLYVAGPVHAFESHQTYFREKVQPLLDDKRKYLGPVRAQDKCRLLAGARCLLIPSLVAETSSLVAMEAISSGTPVVAFASGALGEIVEDGTTGFIVDSQAEMAAVIRNVADISPQCCRAAAEARFDARRMASDYFTLYSSLARSRR